MHLPIPLLDYLLYRVKSIPLSDIQHLDVRERIRLIRALEEISPEEISLQEWNDALNYLCQAPGKSTEQAAKAQLIQLLSHPEDI